ncbi:MAG: pyridoxal phosphate-dependent aminotransferase [Nitriliruptoraceae bacterium]
MSLAAGAAVGPPPGMRIRLSSNESPFGPSPAAVAAATAAVGEAHRYPDDASLDLRAAIAAAEGCELTEVAVGTGSAALLMDLVAERCAGAERPEVVTYERAFVVYRLAARNAGARLVEVPTGGPAIGQEPGYQRDVEALLAAVTERTRLVVVDNPANPTAAHLTGAALEHLAAGLPPHVTLVVDEAYHHFATGQQGYARAAELALAHPDVLVVTTFSKAHALAGLRLGALTGPAARIAAVDAWRPRFNVAAPAQAAALASLADADHLAATVAGTLTGRARLSAGLYELGVPHSAGLGNFVTLEVGRPAAAVVEAFARAGIGVRALAPYHLDEQVRVTVGTPAEVAAFLEVAAEVL